MQQRRRPSCLTQPRRQITGQAAYDKRTAVRIGLSGIVATFASFALSLSVVLASGGATGYCIDPNNDVTYPSEGPAYFWFTQVATATNCTTSACNYTYQTQGAKGNLSTGGNPYTFDNSTQHVLEWITAEENPNDCTTATQTGTGGCWVQVGWEIGHSSSCGGTIQTNSAAVEVEIYDDSSSPCLLSTFGSAPSNASYDSRFYTTLSNGLHRYQVYFEVPGSNNIQDLAYGDFHDQHTAELAAGEAFSNGPTSNGYRYCPVLGQIDVGDWNLDGQPASQSTFASYMNLYTGSWQNWTSSVATTTVYQNSPYKLQPISNFSGGNYTEWESGGPQ